LERAWLARPLRREQRQLAAPRVGADERERVRAIHDVHADLSGDEVGDDVPVRDPERDMVQGLRRHGVSITSGYFLASTARCSCRLFIFERPAMFRRLASLYNSSFVRPL